MKDKTMYSETKEKSPDEIKAAALAAEALAITKKRLVTNMRFMDPAVFALKDQETAGRLLMTDGTSFFYGPEGILSRASESISRLTHDYMHLLLHCILKHYFVSGKIDSRLWNLAADVAVEELRMELNLKCFACKADEERGRELALLRSRYGKLKADRLYSAFKERDVQDLEIKRLGEIFKVDDHRLWYSSESQSFFDFEESDDEDSREKEGSQLVSEKDWDKISDLVRTGIEMDDRDNGGGEESLADSLADIHRKPVDFTTFLRKFARRRETVKIDQNSFDYIYYSYGMELYGDMPLVEPLEYSDEKQISDLVIAIDTSGSTDGPLVRSFIRKSFEILQNKTVIRRKFNIHLIQCDSMIQEAVVLHSRDEVDRYLENMEIKGRGGTDFRPVFRYVNQMLKDRQFRDLRGLLYFTDGKGIFPKKKPSYDTAFIFTDDQEDVQVPDWAMKVEFSEE